MEARQNIDGAAQYHYVRAKRSVPYAVFSDLKGGLSVKCPHCGGEISPAAILGKEGGKKSKRVLTSEQARKMVEARENKKRDKG